MDITLQVNDAMKNALKTLMDKTGVEGYRELLNEALSQLAWAVEEVAQGRFIASVNEADLSYRTRVTPALENVAKTKGKPFAERVQQAKHSRPLWLVPDPKEKGRDR